MYIIDFGCSFPLPSPHYLVVSHLGVSASQGFQMQSHLYSQVSVVSAESMEFIDMHKNPPFWSNSSWGEGRNGIRGYSIHFQGHFRLQVKDQSYVQVSFQKNMHLCQQVEFYSMQALCFQKGIVNSAFWFSIIPRSVGIARVIEKMMCIEMWNQGCLYIYIHIYFAAAINRTTYNLCFKRIHISPYFKTITSQVQWERSSPDINTISCGTYSFFHILAMSCTAD